MNTELNQNETCFYLEGLLLSTSEGVFLAQVSHQQVIFHRLSHFLQNQHCHLTAPDDTSHQIFQMHAPNKRKRVIRIFRT
jgi:hypothetical protein